MQILGILVLMHFKLHSHWRLLAAIIGILPFFSSNQERKKTRVIEKEQRQNADSHS